MDTNEIVERALIELRKTQNYDCLSTSELLGRAGISFLDVDDDQMLDVQWAFMKAAKKEGIILDYSEYAGTNVGLPYNIPSVIIHPDAINSCVIKWEDCGLCCADDIMCAETRILQHEIQVRFFNGNGLMYGRIWPLTIVENHRIFQILDRHVQLWKSEEFKGPMYDGFCWKVKLYTKGKLVKTVEGNIMPFEIGKELKRLISGIIGDDNCYMF